MKPTAEVRMKERQVDKKENVQRREKQRERSREAVDKESDREIRMKEERKRGA